MPEPVGSVVPGPGLQQLNLCSRSGAAGAVSRLSHRGRNAPAAALSGTGTNPGVRGTVTPMKLTKYTHSCVRLERDGNVLVLDPGSFSEVEEALDGASAVLITHEHADHLDQDRVLAQMTENTDLVLYAPAALAARLRSASGAGSVAGTEANTEAGSSVADRILDVEPNSTFTAAGFDVQSFGGQHALIHPLVPMVANVGYLIDGTLYHPGDSFVIPNGVNVQTLLVPLHAPWSKVGEVIDFVIASGAERAYPIHDALLNEAGLGLAEGHVTRFGEMYGTVYQHLSSGESVQV